MTTSTAGLNAALTPLRFLERSATVHPERIACIDGPRRITFAAFRQDAVTLARALRRNGLRDGERVGMLASNSYEALLAQFAVPLAGGVLVAINTRLAPAEVRYICDHAGIRTLFGEQDLILASRRTLDSADLVETYVLIPNGDGTQPQPKHPDAARSPPWTPTSPAANGVTATVMTKTPMRPSLHRRRRERRDRHQLHLRHRTPQGVVTPTWGVPRTRPVGDLAASPWTPCTCGRCRCSTAPAGAPGGRPWRPPPPRSHCVRCAARRSGG